MAAKSLLLASALALFLTGPAAAQEGHAHAGAEASPDAVISAFEEAAAKMHEDMAIDYSGDADVDFVRGMIPHHEAAIAMAKIELEHGKDPQLRKIAEEVIAAQEAEITQMRKWLEEHGK